MRLLPKGFLRKRRERKGQESHLIYQWEYVKNDRDLLAQAKVERAAYNRELNQGVRRLKRLAATAKKK